MSKDMEGLNFEEFKARATSASRNIPRVAIQTRGGMSLNQAAYEALGEPLAIVLLFDKAKRVVALKSSEQGVKHSYPVIKQGNSNSYFITAKAFCSHYDIDISKTRAYEPALVNSMLVFALVDGVEVVTRRGRGSKE